LTYPNGYSDKYRFRSKGRCIAAGVEQIRHFELMTP
jgi:hypothetical protein